MRQKGHKLDQTKHRASSLINSNPTALISRFIIVINHGVDECRLLHFIARIKQYKRAGGAYHTNISLIARFDSSDVDALGRSLGGEGARGAAIAISARAPPPLVCAVTVRRPRRTRMSRHPARV